MQCGPSSLRQDRGAREDRVKGHRLERREGGKQPVLKGEFRFREDNS